MTSNPQETRKFEGTMPSNTGSLSRQQNSDLYKTSTQQRDEIHKLMGQVDMPDESLTISSLSQSPWVSKNRQLFSQTNGTNENNYSNDNEGTLGRSELEGSYDQALNVTRGQNINPSYLVEDEEDEDIHYTHKDSTDKSQDRMIEQSSEVVPSIKRQRKDSKRREDNEKEGDSPDFNRNTYDDLTISKTDLSHTDTSYRENILGDLTKRGQNRTFADSVINHQINNPYTSSSNNNTYRNNYSSNQESHRNSGRRQQLGSRKGHLNNEDQDEEEKINQSSIEERSDDDEDDSHQDELEVSPYKARRQPLIERRAANNNADDNLDSSEFSAVESFTQTQYSKWSKFGGKSNIFPRVQGESIELNDDVSMKKSPNVQRFRNMDGDESLSLTPCSQDGLTSQWQKSQQKSYLANKAANRTVASDQNSLSRFGRLTGNNQNINTMNILTPSNTGNKDTYNTTQMFFGNKHNRSLQRDAELEQALEEESNQQTITLSNSRGIESNQANDLRVKGKDQQSREYQRVSYENQHLQIQSKQLQRDLNMRLEELEQKDQTIQLLQEHAMKLEFTLKDKEDYLALLKSKCHDDSSLEQLRGRNLNQAQKDLKNLAATIQEKEQEIMKLNQELITIKQEDDSNNELYKTQIKKLIEEIDTMRIAKQGLQREKESANLTIMKMRQEFDQQLQHMTLDYERKLSQSMTEIQSLHSQMQKSEKTLKKKEDKMKQQETLIQQQEAQIQSLLKQTSSIAKSITLEKDKEIDVIRSQNAQVLSQMEKEHEKVMKDLKSYKERCKDVEVELQQLRGFENSIGNQSKLKTNSYDMEIKQVRDKFTKQLNKAKEKEGIYMQENTDLKERVKVLEHELKIQSERNGDNQQIDCTDRENQCLKDQVTSLSGQCQDLQQELERQQATVQEITEWLKIDGDLHEKLQQISQELEMKQLLEQEIENLQRQLQDGLQREQRLREALSKGNESRQNIDQISNFSKNLLMNKDKELEQLRSYIEAEKKKKTDLEDQIWKQESEQKILNEGNQALQMEIEALNVEIQKLKDTKDRSERNIDELKDKLRTVVRENDQLKLQQSQVMQQSQVTRAKYLDDIEKKRYEDLITAILELQLAEDPLSQANLSLQSSFIDEFEQALKHLEDQKSLVKAKIEELEKLRKSQQLQITTLAQELSSKSEVIEQMTRQKIRVEEHISNKERHIELLQVEKTELENSCERLASQMKEVESANSKLRVELEEVNTNFRKIMRAQEHLHKGKKPDIKQEQENKRSYEVERVSMGCEDLLSQCVRRIESINQAGVQESFVDTEEIRQRFKQEVLDTLDMIIESQEQLSTFNGLALELAERIDRVRQLALNNCQAPSSHTQLKENACLSMIQNSQEEQEQHLVQSINKWLKQSGLHQQQTMFRNFIGQEDQNSLMLSELISQPKQNPSSSSDPKLSEVIRELQDTIAAKEEEIQALQATISEVQRAKERVEETVQVKDRQLKEAEQEAKERIKQAEEEQKQHAHSMWEEVEKLKEKIKEELVIKTQRLDAEYDELETQKLKSREALKWQQQDLDQKFALRLETHEKELRDRLRSIEDNIRSGCEKSKDEQITQLCQQLEDQYNLKLKSQLDEFSAQVQTLKQEQQQKVEDLKRSKDREMKKVREESDRVRKTYEDKVKKLEGEWQVERECLEREGKEKIEAMTQKSKKDVKTAQDKIRAEMRNQVDAVKNEMAKLKAELEREKKKLVQDSESNIEQMRRDTEEQQEKEMKKEKDKIEKIWKKKLEDQKQEYIKKLEDLDAERLKLVDAHKEDLRKEKERLEQRLKDQVRGDVRLEVQAELENEWQEQLERMRNQQQTELERLKTRYEVIIREERASMIPYNVEHHTKSTQDCRSVDVQCDLQQSHFSEKPEDHYVEVRASQSMNPLQNQSEASAMMNNSVYVEQLRNNFEEELERQQQVFEAQLIAKQQTSIRIFEELLTLEFDKILQSIYHKSNPNSSQVELDMKRNEINKLIADILNRNDDRKDKQMRLSLETLKKKISELLKVFKGELENKLNKKNADLVKQEVLKERLKLANMSDIVSQQQRQVETQSNISSIQSDYQADNQVESQVVSQEPTPRTNNIGNQQRSSEKVKNYLSDIKKYTAEDDKISQANVLRKITPIANSSGVLVVEVDKVLRDLKMLHQSFKISKFYRVLMSAEEELDRNQSEGNDDYESTLQNYRQLLNEMFRSITKLNNGVEEMGKQSEVYKLKLLNAEMKSQISKLQKEQRNDGLNAAVEHILGSFLSEQHIAENTEKCLKLLEDCQLQTNQLQFRICQLVDLFEGDDCSFDEIEERCLLFLQDHPELQRGIMDYNLLMSSRQPDSSRKHYIQPEMLSPEETAKLIANVFSKLNQTASTVQHQPSSHPLDTYQSFFKTFLSNEENVQSAENFIRKFQELNSTQLRSKEQLPLQINGNQRYNMTAGGIKENRPLSNQGAIKRSRSAQSQQQVQQVYQSLPQPSQFSNLRHNHNLSANVLNHTQSTASHHNISNVFQSNNMLHNQQNSIWTQNPNLQSNNNILISNYETLSNHGGMESANTRLGINKSQHQTAKSHNSWQYSKTNMKDEVTATQSSVNALFDRLRTNLQSQHQCVNASKNHSFN